MAASFTVAAAEGREFFVVCVARNCGSVGLGRGHPSRRDCHPERGFCSGRSEQNRSRWTLSSPAALKGRGGMHTIQLVRTPGEDNLTSRRRGVLRLARFSREARKSALAQDDRLSCSAALTATKLFILLDDEGVGHTRNVVADGAGERFLFGFLLVIMRQGLGMLHPEAE